jgi:hypothetical protein
MEIENKDYQNNDEENVNEKKGMYISKSELLLGLANHLQFSISGKDIPQGIKRRYNDFLQLREKLIENWPGVYIPHIPSKKKVGELNRKTVLLRIRALNVFLSNISKIPYLSQSEEIKSFQTLTDDFGKAIEKMPKSSFVEILEKYKNAFPTYNVNYDFNQGKEKINLFDSFLKKIKNNLSTFKKAVDITVDKRKEDILQYFEITHNIISYEKTNVMKYIDDYYDKLIFNNEKNSKLKEKLEKINEYLNNPFENVYNWLYDEEKDIQAMIEAINGINILEMNYNKLKQKDESIENDIKKLESGQQGFIKNIFKKKEESLSELNQEKNKNANSIKNLNEIIKIVTYEMENKISEFKIEKTNNYVKMIKEFANNKIQSNKKLNELFIEMKDLLEQAKQNHIKKN